MKPDWSTRLKIFGDWQSGETQASLAKKYQMSISRVSQICADTKIRIKRGWTPDQFCEPGRPSEGKRKTSVSFDPDVWDAIKSLGWRERSKFINQSIRDNLAKSQ